MIYRGKAFKKPSKFNHIIHIKIFRVPVFEVFGAVFLAWLAYTFICLIFSF